MLLTTTFLAYEGSAAAVTLLYFTGYGDEDGVNLEWETATELDTSGFYIRRSTTQHGTYTRIPEALPEFLDATGDSLIGDYYFFLDDQVIDNTGYWYQLEVVDNNGQGTMDEPPIQVIAGVFATQPSGSTSTDTAPTPGTPTAIRTPTSTPDINSTPYPGPVTATSAFRFSTQTPAGSTISPPGSPAATADLSPTESISATATLVPLPELTLQFPTPAEALGSSNLKTGIGRQDSETGGRQAVWFTLERLIFLGFILLIWIILGGWFYLSYRRTE